VDNKGRINIPARLRKYVSPEANDTFVITRGYDACLFVYPLDEWNKLEQSIRGLASTNPKHRYFMRTLLERATECQLDGQSRITIPKDLLQFAGIEAEVVILGVLERIELWNPATYREYVRAQSDSYESVAQTVLQK
jgi:MraZ protein